MAGVTGRSTMRASTTADPIRARSCRYVPAMVTPGDSPSPSLMFPPASSTSSAITPTPRIATNSVASIAANGAHSGQRGSPSARSGSGGGSGRHTPSGSSGRRGGEPGCS